MLKFSEVFNEEIIRSECKMYENLFIEDHKGDDKDYEGNYSVFLSTLVSGAHGRYIPVHIISALGITEVELGLEEDDEEIPEWFWDTLTNTLEPNFVKEFNKELNNRGIEGFVYLGFFEADGSYGLFYYMDADLVERLREEEAELGMICEPNELDDYRCSSCGRPSEMCNCGDYEK